MNGMLVILNAGNHWQVLCNSLRLFIACHLVSGKKESVRSGLSKRSFWKTVVLPLPKTGGFDEKWRKSDIAFYHKNKDFSPQTPKIDENDENGGCHPDKMTVCQKHRFDNPESGELSSSPICAVCAFIFTVICCLHCMKLSAHHPIESQSY